MNVSNNAPFTLPLVSSRLNRKKNVASIRHENTLLNMASTLNGYSNSTVIAICTCINNRLTIANPNSNKNLKFNCRHQFPALLFLFMTIYLLIFELLMMACYTHERWSLGLKAGN